jgi:hypothetical protein
MRSRRGALRHRFSAWLRTFTLDYLPEPDPSRCRGADATQGVAAAVPGYKGVDLLWPVNKVNVYSYVPPTTPAAATR